MKGHRRINVCCDQESRWKVRLISAKGFKYKFIWSRDNSGFGGVDVLFNENCDKVISVVKMNHQIMFICILVGKLIINIFSIYASQTGLSVVEKDSFSSALPSNISIVSSDEYLFACGDFNRLVGKVPGFNGVHGGLGFGSSNADGIKFLIYVQIVMKPDSHLVTYLSFW